MTSTADNTAMKTDYSAVDLTLIDPISNQKHRNICERRSAR